MRVGVRVMVRVRVRVGVRVGATVWARLQGMSLDENRDGETYP